MERVLGIDTDHEHDEFRTEVINFSVQPWLAGSAVSSVQLTVGGLRPQQRRVPSPRR